MAEQTAASSRPPLVNSGGKRLAVVLFNLGGPDKLESVQPFLFNLFNDPAIIGLPWPARPLLAQLISTRRRKEASENYAVMGGSSPLLPGTEAQARELEARLAVTLPGIEARCFIAMRYWHPLTDVTAKAVQAFKPDEVVLLPLYPQYSTTTTGSSTKAWRKAYKGSGQVREVCCFFDVAGLAAAHAHHIRQTFEAAGKPKGVRLLFSAHGLPEQVIQRGDPYQWQIERTCEAVVRELGEGWDWEVCYQSRGRPAEVDRALDPRGGREGGCSREGCAGRAHCLRFRTYRDACRAGPRLCRTRSREGLSSLPARAGVGIEPAFVESLAGLVGASLFKTGCNPGAGACDRKFSQCPYHKGGAGG